MNKRKEERMATIIRVNGTTEEVEMDKEDGLLQMQKIVGGYIEAVPVDGGYLIVNEDGRREGLSRNSKACDLYGGLIVGDVLFCTSEEFEEDDYEGPEEAPCPGVPL